MKTQNILKQFVLLNPRYCTIVLATLLLLSCSDDPEPVNEEEVITTFRVLLTPVVGTPVTLEFYDEDGDGSIDPVYTYSPASPGGNDAILVANTTYSASIELLNETVDPAESITEEIEEEAEEHIFCFSVDGANLTVVNRNEDANSLPVGLTSTWTTATASSGTINIILRHQPGTKNGDCPGSGNTDIDVTFNVVIQ